MDIFTWLCMNFFILYDKEFLWNVYILKKKKKTIEKRTRAHFGDKNPAGSFWFNYLWTRATMMTDTVYPYGASLLSFWKISWCVSIKYSWDALPLTTAPHSFSARAREHYQKLAGMHGNMNTLFQNMVEYFAIDPKKTSVDELFTDLSNFRAMFVVSGLASRMLWWWWSFFSPLPSLRLLSLARGF